MCRLALMNANVLQVLSQQELATVFAYLEQAQGGHGNGCAALWQETAQVKIRKSITLTAGRAAQHLASFGQAQADWLLYHTRWASSGRKITRNCHPFQTGNLTLAHNGHDWTWARLGSRLGITDSECITRLWGRLALPLDTLMEVDGVFLGFRGAFPFVVKTRSYDDLVLAVNHAAGALLFISQLPQTYYDRFDEVIELGRFSWLGASPLDLNLLPRRWRYESSLHRGDPYGFVSSARYPQLGTPAENDHPSVNQLTQTEAAEITIEDLRMFLAKIEARQEHASSAASTLPALPPPVDPTA